MINVLVPITEKVEEFATFVENHAKANTKFYVGVTEDLQEKFPKIKGVEVHVFKSGTNREKILNSLHKIKLKRGRLVVVRRALTDKEFDAMCNSAADIVKFKTHHNKFVSFFKNLAKKIIKRIFAFNYFDDISGIAYNENLFELMMDCPNISMATRVDRYVGVEFEEIEAEGQPVKRIYNKWVNALWFALGLLVMLGSFAGGILIFVFVPKIWVVWVLLILMWWMLAVTTFCVTSIRFTRAIAVGDLNYEDGEEIEKERR